MNSGYLGKIHGIPFGTPFFSQFFTWFQKTVPSSFEQARTKILVPTKRAVRSFEEAARQLPGTCLLPKFIALSDVGSENPFQIPALQNLPPIISPLQRYAFLEKLVGSFLKNSNYSSTRHYVLSLMDVLDELMVHGVTLDQLSAFNAGIYGEHFQKTFDLLKLILIHWPFIMKEAGVMEAQEYTKTCFSLLIHHLNESPSSDPIILAGSTGSLPTTRHLMKTILRRSNGYVVLPGADEDIFSNLPPTHPKAGLADLVKELCVSKEMCTFAPGIHSGQLLLKAAFDDSGFDLPKNVTSDNFPEMVEGQTLLEEAKIVALMCRHHLEENQPVTIVCPNPALQNHIVHELERFKVVPNISLGTALSCTVVGGFLMDLASLKNKFSLPLLFQVLKHPLCFKASPQGRLNHLEKVRQLETNVSRTQAFQLDKLWADVVCILEPFFKEVDTLDGLFETAYALTVGEVASSTPFDTCPLFEKEDGAALKVFYEELKKLGLLAEKLDHLQNWMNLTPPVRFYDGVGSPVKILGTLEARLVVDQVVILTSLNEEIWPKPVTPNCWIHRNLREHLKLPPLESFIGLAAHDFASCFHGQKIYMTRSYQNQGKTAEPSRFWQRLMAVIQKNNISRVGQNPWLRWVRSYNQPEENIYLTPPTPCPSIVSRPQSLTISDIDLLVKDPYGFYAKRILNLAPLRPLEGETHDRIQRGIIIHAVLEYALQHPNTSIEFYLDRLFKKLGVQNSFWAQQFISVVSWVRDDLKKRPVIQNFLEHKADMKVTVQGTEFTVQGRLDRVDYDPNRVVVIDYKTGTPPSTKDIKDGYAPQLPVEVLMLHQGEVEKINHVNSMEIWHVRGFAPIVDITEIAVTPDFIEKSQEGLNLLLETFLCQETPFLACPNPKKSPSFLDYEHLERISEWQRF